MGHNSKTAARNALVIEAKGIANEAKGKIAALAKECTREKKERDRELLELEKRLLDEIIELRSENIDLLLRVNSLSRPIHRKAIDWTRNVIQKAASSSPAPPELPELESELIETDFDDEETDPAIGVPVASALVDIDPKTEEPIGIVQHCEDIGQEDAGRAEGEPKSDAISAGEEDTRKTMLERLHDPNEILKRLEYRLEAEKATAADIMENQELDQEERAELMDRSIAEIEEFQRRIAHQKLILDGVTEAPE